MKAKKKKKKKGIHCYTQVYVWDTQTAGRVMYTAGPHKKNHISYERVYHKLYITKKASVLQVQDLHTVFALFRLQLTSWIFHSRGRTWSSVLLAIVNNEWLWNKPQNPDNSFSHALQDRITQSLYVIFFLCNCR